MGHKGVFCRLSIVSTSETEWLRFHALARAHVAIRVSLPYALVELQLTDDLGLRVVSRVFTVAVNDPSRRRCGVPTTVLMKMCTGTCVTIVNLAPSRCARWRCL